MTEEFLWVDKYRPTKVADCILPDRLKTKFQQYVKKKSIPNLMLAGTTGVGKTSVAIAMCEEIGLSYLKINGAKNRGIDVVRTQIQNFGSTMSLKGGRKVIILDEADGLTAEAQESLKGLIEELSSNCTFIFTCNFKARLIEAIHSRCAVIEFHLTAQEKPAMAAQFFKSLSNILENENVSFDKPVLAKIIEKHFPDFRRTIGELQHLAQSGAIDAGALAEIGEIRRMSDLAGYLKDKDFSKMRKWVVLNSDIDTSKIYRKIYDGLSDMMAPHSVPLAVVTLARYQYQAAFVADQEVNLVACLTELMVDCEYN